MMRSAARARWGVIVLYLLGGNLALGYLIQARPPDWERWIELASCHIAIAAAASGTLAAPRTALMRIGLKTALWPAIAAGLAGAARLARLDLYAPVRLEWLAVLSLAGAHAFGECVASTMATAGAVPTRDAAGLGERRSDAASGRERRALWLLDVQWIVAILGVPWSWRLAPSMLLAELLGASLPFLWLVRPGDRRLGARAAASSRAREPGDAGRLSRR